MAAASPSSRRRGPPAVAWVLLLAVLVGVAAALLSRPVGSYAPSSSTVGGLTVNQLSDIVLIVLVGCAGFWLFLTFRDVGNRFTIPSRAVVTILVILLLGVIFVGVAGLVHLTPLPANGNSTGRSNNTGGFTNGSGNGTLGPLSKYGVAVPAWAGYVAVVAVAALAALLLLPLMIARAEARRQARGGEEGPARQVQNAIAEALQRLNSGDGSDPRATILALYARLLLLVGPRLGTVDSRTPGEIAHDSIESLGLRPRVAQDLTQTFEEARYSTHIMTTAAVDRARDALAEAISDLATSAGVPA